MALSIELFDKGNDSIKLARFGIETDKVVMRQEGTEIKLDEVSVSKEPTSLIVAVNANRDGTDSPGDINIYVDGGKTPIRTLAIPEQMRTSLGTNKKIFGVSKGIRG